MYKKTITLTMVLLIGLVLNQSIYSQTNQVTYQGSLNFQGAPANGNFDFVFRIYDALAGGNQLGETIPIDNVAVTEGVFSVILNTGNRFNSGEDRWLEIRARQTGGPGIYATLTPRQPVTSAPYSIRSKQTDTANTATNATQLGGIAADQFVLTTDARLSDARTPTPGSGDYIQNSTSEQAASNFNISGTGTADILSADTQFNLGDSKFISGTFANMVIGVSAGSIFLSGVGNSFVGSGTGAFNTTGSSNSFFGDRAGRNNSTGSRNSFFGAQAGQGSTASDNTFFGFEAGTESSTVGENSFFGSEAGKANNSGEFNSFFGRKSGWVNTSGNSNSFFGYESGLENTTGDGNSFFGYESGQMSNGFFNSYFGKGAGKTNSSSSYNSFFGNESGAGNFGASNAFFGSESGVNNTTGSGNVFVGRNAGNTNTTGGSNTAIGGNANLGSDNLVFATAIGADTIVTTSGTIQLGRLDQDIVRIGKLDTAGSTSICLNGTNAISTCSSSIRYKSNVEDFRSGLDLIRKLRPVSFIWKEGGMPDFGLIAEKVAEVEPLLTTTLDGKTEGVKYDRVGVVLVNAVNEQQEQIEALKEKVKVEKVKNESQGKEMDRLSAEVDLLNAIVCELKPETKVCKTMED